MSNSLNFYLLLNLCVTQASFAFADTADTAYSVKFQFIGGSRQLDTLGVYGEKGVKSSKNYPGGRFDHAMCLNPLNGNILVFGGLGYQINLENSTDSTVEPS